jgi:Hermansky-Pudlak syndrome 5 protein
VLHTAQLKAALSVNPTNSLKFKTDRIPNTNNNQHASPSKSAGTVNKQQRQFTKLYKICHNYLLTHNETSFYIIDPTTSSILLWNNQFANIESVKVAGNNLLYIFTKTNNVFRLRIVPIEQEVFAQLYAGKYVEAATLIRQHLSYFEEKSKYFSEKERSVLNRMQQALENLDGEYDELVPMFSQIRCDDNNEIAIPASQMENGIYILENNVYKQPSPINNNRNAGDPADVADGKSVLSNLDKNLKDALISVVRGSSYGKNIQQFVSFQSVSDEADDMQSGKVPFMPRNFDVDLLNETVPIVSMKRVPNILLDASSGISEEEKTVRDLYLIYRSSQISNLNFFDRYAAIFDEFDTATIIRLLRALEQFMLKNGDMDAQKNGTKIYFDYLRPELIWELEEMERQFIKDGFILLNATTDAFISCQNCKFPVKSSATCLYPEIGTVLLQFYWSRQDAETCWQLARAIPFLLQQMLKFYSQKSNENQSKLVALSINMGKQVLFNKAVECFDANSWQDAFTYFHRTLAKKTIQCFFCDKLTEIDDNFFESDRIFYTWNHFLENAVNFLDTHFLFDLLKLYSSVIPRDEISRYLYLKCLANA